MGLFVVVVVVLLLLDPDEADEAVDADTLEGASGT